MIRGNHRVACLITAIGVSSALAVAMPASAQEEDVGSNSSPQTIAGIFKIFTKGPGTVTAVAGRRGNCGGSMCFKLTTTQTATVKAIPAVGYRVKTWSGPPCGQQTVCTFTGKLYSSRVIAEFTRR